MAARDAGRDTIGLRQAAELLGVHYMTVYKYVRTGRLPATRDGSEWRVAVRDVAALRRGEQAPTPGPHRVPGGRARVAPGPRSASVSRLRDRLVAGDEAGAWSVVEAAQASGADAAEVYTNLLSPALRAVGDGWARGSLTVADEHRATAVALRIVGRLGPRFARRGRRRGRVVVGAPAGELHALPVAIVADLLRGAGFDVAELGANTPAESFVDAASSPPPARAVAICATTAAALDGFSEAARALHAACPGVAVLAGGSAVEDHAHALRLGADAYTGPDASDAVDAVERAAR